MERMEALTNYYTTHNEDAQLTSKHGMVEFLTTIHYVEKYLNALYAGKKIIGYMSLSKESDDAFELHNLAVLPEYRHNGFGKLLLDHAKDVVKASGGHVIKIGMIEENTALKNWYEANGFVHTAAKKFEHLPFTSGYMDLFLKQTDDSTPING